MYNKGLFVLKVFFDDSLYCVFVRYPFREFTEKLITDRLRISVKPLIQRMNDVNSRDFSF